MRIEIKLPRDRTRQGRVALIADDGSALLSERCLGRGDVVAARARGNPTLDPAKPFGNSPLGSWASARIIHFQPGIPEAKEHSFGPYGWITWNEPPRFGLGLHGGDFGPAQKLRPTHGCVRTTNEFMRKLFDVLEASKLSTIDVSVQENGEEPIVS